MDALFGTCGNEMEQRVLARLGEDFQVGSEDWDCVAFDITKNSLDTKSPKRAAHWS